MKRVFLFLLTNIAVMVVLSVTLSILGVNRFLAANGLNIGMLLVFSAVVGFAGSFISLLLSKTMAKWFICCGLNWVASRRPHPKGLKFQTGGGSSDVPAAPRSP